MEEGYTQLGTVLIDQRLADSEEDGVIVVGRFKGDRYDGVQLSYDAIGRYRRCSYRLPGSRLTGLRLGGKMASHTSVQKAPFRYQSAALVNPDRLRRRVP